MQMNSEYIGKLQLNDKVDITDPCYDKDVWCRMTSECKSGEYTGYATIDDVGNGWEKRVVSIAIYKDDKIVDIDSMELIGNIGVDAGLAGFFNNKPDFNDDEWRDFLNKFVRYDKRDYWDCGYGLFSESGYGDGGYDVYATPDRDAFMIVFIDDKEVSE